MNRIYCYEIDLDAVILRGGNGPHFIPNDCGSIANRVGGGSLTIEWDNGDEVVLRGGERSLLPKDSFSFHVYPIVANVPCEAGTGEQ